MEDKSRVTPETSGQYVAFEEMIMYGEESESVSVGTLPFAQFSFVDQDLLEVPSHIKAELE